MSGENDIEVTPKLEDYLSKLEKLETPTIRAEAWVDMDLKYFRNVRIPVSVDGTEVTSYIDLGLEYDGGDVFPFYVQFSESTDKTGDSTFLELSVTLNKISKEMTLGFSTHSLLGSQNIVANGELKLTPSDKPVLVERPEGAKNVSELLNIIGQNSSFGLNDTSDKFDLNTLQLDDIEL